MRRLLLLLLLAAPAGAAEPPLHAARQVVVSAHSLASEAGLAMLRAGGSAADAAVAVQAVLSVVEPQASGLGGGALVLHWNAATGALTHIEGIAGAPANLPTARLTEGTAGAATAARSGRAVAVPGAIAMLGALHAAEGRLPWAQLFEPAIRAADQGFSLPPYLHQALVARATFLARVPALRAIFLDAEGRPLPAGTLVRNPAQAEALRLLAAGGPEALRQGPLAEAILAAVAASPNPGWITATDLASYAPHRREPVCATLFGRRVCSAAPPASGGVGVLQQVAMLEAAGIARLAPDSAEAAHLLLEASRLAAADRRRWIGDPEQVSVPTDGLLDPAYLRDRAGRIDPAQAMANVVAGDPPRRHGALPPDAAPLAEAATSHVAIRDAAGNALSLTTTNNLNFGAEIVAAGFVLNNGMTNFSSNPGSAEAPAQNRMRGAARPATTMAPTIVFGADGRPEAILGAGGGARIIDAVATALVEMLAWNRGAATATARARIGAQADPATAEIEAGTPAEALLPALRALGHAVRPATMNTGLQIIQRDRDGWTAAPDPRRDGAARGD
jgi:gamma-glutamyltranspeptidase/glutathione hydrolase